MPDILEKKQIPYKDQAQRLFNLYEAGETSSAEQQIVPFLGAGVSISGRTSSVEPNPSPTYPDRQKLDMIFGELGLDGQAKTFLEIAILLACRLQFSQSQSSSTTGFKSDDYPPSAGELAQLFSQLSSYTRFKQVATTIKDRLPDGILSASDEELIEMLKLLANESGIANPPDPLTSITGYYESVSDRDSLWKNLRFIGTKSTLSKTHRLLAAAAKQYIDQTEAFDDYLIITTNYDCLMEAALDALDVPYAVLVTRRSDQKVLVRFSNKLKDAAKLNQKNSKKQYPNYFNLSKPMKLVVLYKIHGCLNPGLEVTDDSVVISDSDYINYISQMGTNQGVIPAYVTSLMENRRFLFLGYSLSDWNVRSIYETLKKKRIRDKNIRDFAVMRKVEEYEKVFFDNNNIQIIMADLNDYVDGIRSHLSEKLRSLVDGKPDRKPL